MRDVIVHLKYSYFQRCDPSRSPKGKVITYSTHAAGNDREIIDSPIELPGRPIDEVPSRFLSIRNMVEEPLFLREVSSRIFWGLSNIRDGRGDVIAVLIELNECPFPEQPIILNVQ